LIFCSKTFLFANQYVEKIVQVYTDPTKNPVELSLGVLYNDQLVLTCFHGLKNSRSNNFTVFLNSTKGIPARLLTYGETEDIALLKLEETVNGVTLVNIRIGLLKDKESFYYSPNPLFPWQFRGKGLWIGKSFLNENGKVVLGFRLPVYSGCSGGGVFDEEDNLVGIIQSTTIWNNNKITLVIPGEEISRFLKRSGIKCNRKIYP